MGQQIEALAKFVAETRWEDIPAEVQKQTKLVLLGDIAARSNLAAEQINAELPKAFSRLLRMHQEIAQFRTLMETEPEIAPFVEIAAAAVASGRRPDLAAALPLMDDDNRKTTAKNAASQFGLARPYFVSGGFGQDIERLDAALSTARRAAGEL